jgi:phosphoglycerol transferase MdoB-like AlkP superfamily enzyme
MFKDAFTDLAGFDDIYGAKDFSEPILRAFWGVDDLSLFRKGLTVIEDLESAAEPWFLAVLSVGTHHPVVVPSEHLERHEGSDVEAAFDYLDGALQYFMTELEASGVLENTLVIVTADESARGFPGRAELELATARDLAPADRADPRRCALRAE